MLCSIFRSLFWAQTVATRVKYGFFHLRDGIASQNVSAFGPFGICFVCVCVLGMLSLLRLAFSSVFSGCQRSCSHSLPCLTDGVVATHLTTCLQMTGSVPVLRTAFITFLFPWERVQGGKYWVFSASYGPLLISWISSFSLLSPVTRGHCCSTSY